MSQPALKLHYHVTIISFKNFVHKLATFLFTVAKVRLPIRSLSVEQMKMFQLLFECRDFDAVRVYVIVTLILFLDFSIGPSMYADIPTFVQ